MIGQLCLEAHNLSKRRKLYTHRPLYKPNINQHCVRPTFYKRSGGIFTHLDATVQTVAVKAMTPGGDYYPVVMKTRV